MEELIMRQGNKFCSKVAQMRAIFAMQRGGGIITNSELAQWLKVSVSLIPSIAKLVGGLYPTMWEGKPAYTDDIKCV